MPRLAVVRQTGDLGPPSGRQGPVPLSAERGMRASRLRASVDAMHRAFVRLPLRDSTLAVALLLAKLLILATGVQVGDGLLSYLLAPLWTLPLAWRRRYPTSVALIVVGTAAVEAGVGGYHDSIVALTALLLVHYALGAYTTTARRLVAGLVPVLAIDLWTALGPEALSLQGLVGVGALVAAAVLGGLWVRQLRLRAQTSERLAVQLQRERDERARTAVAEERARIARELHDEVAHAMSVIAVQADAAQGALAHDPALVEPPLVAIRDTARDALTDMRRVLGALHSEGDAQLTPEPGLARLPGLLEQARISGLDVDLRVEGEPRPLPPALDLAAYRVLQEGLTNIRKHSGSGRAEVMLSYSAGTVGLEVVDHGDGSGTGGGSGHGLAGIRERVALLGGEFAAHPSPRGFALRVTLPLA